MRRLMWFIDENIWIVREAFTWIFMIALQLAAIFIFGLMIALAFAVVKI